MINSTFAEGLLFLSIAFKVFKMAMPEDVAAISPESANSAAGFPTAGMGMGLIPSADVNSVAPLIVPYFFKESG